MDGTLLDTVLADVLAACVDAYATVAGAPDLPARRFYTHGQPVWDAEQLVVSAVGMKPVKPFPQTQIGRVECAVILGVDVAVEVVRSCWPTKPDAQGLQDAAATLSRDASTLWTHLARLATTGTLIRSIPAIGCKNVALGVLAPKDPQGTFAGWRWPLSLQVAIP